MRLSAAPDDARGEPRRTTATICLIADAAKCDSGGFGRLTRRGTAVFVCSGERRTALGGCREVPATESFGCAPAHSAARGRGVDLELRRAGYRNVASLGPYFGGALVLWPPNPSVDRGRVDQIGEPGCRRLRPGMLIDDGFGAAVDVRGHVHRLQAWRQARVGEVDGRGDVRQGAGSVAVGSDPLVVLKLRLVLFLGRDLVSNHNGLLTAAVNPAVVVETLEKVAQYDRMRRSRVGVASVQAANVDAAEEVVNAGVETCLEDSCVDPCRLTMSPPQGAPVSAPAHELVAMEFGVGGHWVAWGRALTHSLEPFRNKLPGCLIGDGGTDEVGVLVIGLIDVGD